MKDLNIYYFDNEMGNFDKFNPRFVMNLPYSKKILNCLSKKHNGSFLPY